MKKFITVIAALIAIIVIAMFAIGKQYHFETSRVIQASPAEVWTHMSSMQAFNQWNPFMDLDPDVKVEYSGTPGAVGDQYCWEGNRDAGKGCHVVTAMVPNQQQSTKMMFEVPFESEATSDLVLTPEGNGTKVTWSMDCELDYPFNLMGIFMDKEMEKSYGSGLEKLKVLSEK